MPVARFFFFFLALCLFYNGLHAQENRLQKGSLCLGGSLGFSYAWQLDSAGGRKFSGGHNDYRFHILPATQYFLSGQLSVGLAAGLNYKGTELSNSGKMDYKLVQVTVAPSVQYYKLLAGETFGFLLSAQVPYNYLLDKPNGAPIFSDPGKPYRENVRSIGLRMHLALFYFPARNWMLQASVADLFSWTRTVYKPERNNGPWINHEIRGLDFKTQGLSLSAFYFLGKQKVN